MFRFSIWKQKKFFLIMELLKIGYIGTVKTFYSKHGMQIALYLYGEVSAMKRMKFLIILLALIFLILTENVNVVNILLAILVSLFVVFINKNELQTMEIFKIKTLPSWILYIVLLVKEVAIANIQVAIIVLSPKMNISPRIVKYESKLKGDMFLTILANSITLTPGTMTVSIDKNILDIHCLNKDYEDSLENNLFEKMLLRIEGVQNE